MAFAGGCNPGSGSRPVSLSIWQEQIEDFVVEEANGDASSLRHLEVETGRPGFRAFSHDRPEESRDIAGVLVGVHSESERLWYVYLVGHLERERVEQIHLAAMRPSVGSFEWRIGGDADGRGVQTYRDWQIQRWQQTRDEAAEPPPRAATFPNDTDQLSFKVVNDLVTVSELSSGATWTLSLNGME